MDTKLAVFTSISAIKGWPGYRERSGQTVEIVRPLTREESDELMYRVRFADGEETDAFADELMMSDNPV
jgi:hypothetical protein